MDEIREDIYLAALAGLLHDIGKFAQRAGEHPGKHAEVGADVARRYVPKPWREHLYPIMAHHDSVLLDLDTKRITLADRLSASERVDEDGTQPRQLLSILTRLESPDGAPLPAPGYWPLEPLQLKRESLFPGAEASQTAERDGYQSLWKLFEAEAQALLETHASGQNLPVYLESLLLLLQRTTWCVPSAFYRSLPDVSLYDHSRMTAALATCLLSLNEVQVDTLLQALAAWYRAGEGTRPPDVLRTTSVGLLVGGDLSGVQDFIYTVAPRGATSALRGRSFYLQLLTEALARYVLRELGLPITNVIYQGGGNFYLLVPPDAVEKLGDIRRYVSDVLWRHHAGDLYLALAWQSLSAVDLCSGRIGEAWEALGQQQQRAKQRRFAETPATLAGLFEPLEHGGNEETQCSVCGREHSDIERIETVRKCRPCRAYEALGKDLRRARYLTLESIGARRAPDAGAWDAILGELGLRASVSAAPPNRTDEWRVLLALDDQALSELRPATGTAIGRRFVVNVTPIITRKEIEALADRVEDLPTEAESVKPFSVMAAQAKGIDRLGVLRMDVDGLGRLLSEGLGKTASLSRVAALSFSISLFFDGWVGEIAREQNAAGKSEARGDTLYTIYSGGDDLFFVGSWDQVVPLAQRIRADLAEFAGHHPNVHASAGIALIGGKHPLHQAAKDAGDAEKAAKHLRWQDADGHSHTKDAVTFLDVTLPWAQFGFGERAGDLSTVSRMAAHLLKLREEGVPHSILRTLLQLYGDYRKAADARAVQGLDQNQAGEDQTLYGPWLWRGYYQLKRDKGNFAAVDDLAERLHADQFRMLAWLGVAARWAELLLR